MAILLVGPSILDLYEHAANGSERFDPPSTGLDHFAFRADSYADLEQWAHWLDTKAVERSEIRETGGVGWMFDFVRQRCRRCTPAGRSESTLDRPRRNLTRGN
jgi:hypothetical protein